MGILNINKNKIKSIATNRKALYEYEILDKLEAGIVLVGTEVKSARDGKVILKGGHIIIKDGDAWLEGCHIAEYSMAFRDNHNPLRSRKLLLHKREIRNLQQKVKEKGLTIVPLSMYFSNGKVKVEIALSRGKKLWDKRADIAEKDSKRRTEQALSQKY